MEDTLKRKSFGRQLLLSYLVVAILPISFLIFYLLYDVINTTFNDAKNHVDNTAKFVSSQFESQFTNLSFLSIIIRSGLVFFKILKCSGHHQLYAVELINAGCAGVVIYCNYIRLFVILTQSLKHSLTCYMVRQACEWLQA